MLLAVVCTQQMSGQHTWYPACAAPESACTCQSSHGAATLTHANGLQQEVPELLELLQQKGLADQMDLLEHVSQAQDTLTPKQDSLYGSVHNILARVCKANSWQGRISGTTRSNTAVVCR